MNVFTFRDLVVNDYRSYVSSFVSVLDPMLREYVENSLNSGVFWPEPLVQLNPHFEPGGSVTDLVAAGVLHPGTAEIFAFVQNGVRTPMNLHRHQREAVLKAQAGESFVVTTGTGSGKSLTYMLPIVDHVLKRGSGQGIQAIVVYPMNALANSQREELIKFLGAEHPQVSFARYTGQESREEKDRVLAAPPDILLTNYMMLELILTRQDEAQLVEQARGLKFLVFDELHTYRGRQGADVSLLIRRLRDRLDAHDVICVGTSATMSSSAVYAERQADVARVASRIFGVEISPGNVIGEFLQRATRGDTSPAALRAAAVGPEPDTAAAFVQDPLATWLEATIGMRWDEQAGRFDRQPPRPLTGERGLAPELAGLTGLTEGQCREALQARLLGGHRLTSPETGRPLFAFRLHQFISKASTVYAPLVQGLERLKHLTLQGQLFAPGTGRSLRLYPLEFCRNCGHEYHGVRHSRDEGTGREVFLARSTLQRDEGGSEDGYLYLHSPVSEPWPEDEQAQLARLPGGWVDVKDDRLKLKASHRADLPQLLRVNGTGEVVQAGGLRAAFVAQNFKFCLHCGVSYVGRTGKLTKLATLSSEGRSTATTLISMAAVQGLRQSNLPVSAQKILSFTDNRQDASLQAGHFNDFVFTSSLRAGLARALEAGPIEHDELAAKVYAAMNLDFASFAADPGVRFRERDRTIRAVQDLIGYALFTDLAEGKKLTLPNLERVDLVRFEYPYLRDVCEAQDLWARAHPALSELRSGIVEIRERVSRQLLDWMRQQLAIKTRYLDRESLDAIEASMGLIREDSPLYLSPDEWRRAESGTVVTLGTRPPGRGGEYDVVYLGPLSALGKYLVRDGVLGWRERLNSRDAEAMLADLMVALSEFILPVGHAAYQLKGTGLTWLPGDGSRAYSDPLRVIRRGDAPPPNSYFLHLYRQPASRFHDLSGAEHTAQIGSAERELREEQFRAGTLPALFCSPTMELGVDISDLNVVNMRNVPPTPANYAQRSGRAGRSGQPALVLTYATTGNSHDQYFFRRPDLMVGGVVTTPRLELGNEALVRSHVHAAWLAETNHKLPRSLAEVLDMGGEQPELRVIGDLWRVLTDPGVEARGLERARRLIESLSPHLDRAGWYSEEWLSFTIKGAAREFDRACERWRDLYRAALSQLNHNNAVLADASKRHLQEQARRLHAEASTQLRLLRDPDGEQADFSTYRYLASEGFLPGYNFARLPLSAYLPGRRQGRGTRDSYLSRPRFLAVSEFGPGAIIYHNGSKYEAHKVIVPSRGDSSMLPTVSAQRCEACGYLHHGEARDARDVCEGCGARLEPALPNLFRMQSVATRRRERIGSDEEERQRIGFEVKSGLRFASRGGHADRVEASASAVHAGTPLLNLTYGDSATLWRVNYGWRSRKNKFELGFLFDTETSQWISRSKAAEAAKTEGQQEGRIQRVIPFVEDTRNVLLIEPTTPADARVMASLMSALKNAVQIRYQLEDSELAAEVLPDATHPRRLLFYEASEGGAGVLSDLLFRPGALASVAEEALRLLHFDPRTGEDRRRAAHAHEDCVAACYDCLMTYGNQQHHELLDRHAVKDLLLQLAGGEVVLASAVPVGDHAGSLKAQCGSDLERAWLDFLLGQKFRLPSHAQQLVPGHFARPDFSYQDDLAVVFIDGPHHLASHTQARDARVREELDLAGYTVVSFTHDPSTWPAVARQYSFLFGEA